jgi:hypothetical protein
MNLILSPGNGVFGSNKYSKLHNAYPYFIEGSYDAYARIKFTKGGTDKGEIRLITLSLTHCFATLDEWMDSMGGDFNGIHEEEKHLYFLDTSCDLPKFPFTIGSSNQNWPFKDGYSYMGELLKI